MPPYTGRKAHCIAPKRCPTLQEPGEDPVICLSVCLSTHSRPVSRETKKKKKEKRGDHVPGAAGLF